MGGLNHFLSKKYMSKSFTKKKFNGWAVHFRKCGNLMSLHSVPVNEAFEEQYYRGRHAFYKVCIV